MDDSGSIDPRLERLLEQWDRHRSEGRDLDATALTADLELLPALEGQIRVIRAMEGRLGGSPPQPESTALGTPSRYQIIKELARGGMGIVYVAKDLELGRDVAYKVIRAEVAREPRYLAKFKFEATVTAKLQHPGIVPVYGLNHDEDGRPAYAMRRFDGESLLQYVQNFHANSPRHLGRKRTWSTILSHFVRCCRTVHYAHEMRILHRDLSPRNILITGDDETIVLDWGLAAKDAEPAPPDHAQESEELDTPTRAGTAAYVAPEILMPRSNFRHSRQSDVYSLGALLYLILTGEPPYSEETNADVAAAIGQGPPRSPQAARPGVPRPLAAICKRAMARAREDRYPTADLLANDVEAWLLNERVAADSEPPWEVIGRSALRHPTSASILGALVLIAALAGVTVSIYLEGKRTALEARTNGLELQVAQQAVEAKESTDALRALAFRKNAEANQLWVDGHFDEAKIRIRENIPLLEEWVKRDRRDATRSATLATTYSILADMIHKKSRDKNEPLEGLAHYERALTLFSASFDIAKPPAISRDIILNTWKGKSDILANLGRPTEALMARERALALASSTELSLRLTLKIVMKALLLVAEGEQANKPWSRGEKADHGKATRLADYLAEYPGTSPNGIYNAAVVFALASRDTSVDTAERERRAARGVALLGEIVTGGYFRSDEAKLRLDTDHDLDPIREREDFRDLLARLGLKASSRGKL